MSQRHVFPTPRVMSAEVLINRYLADVSLPRIDTDLVQVWVVGRDHADEAGHPMVRVAFQSLDGSLCTGLTVSMRKSTFESLVPLASLIALPDDPELIDELDLVFTEPRIAGTEPEAPQAPSIPSVDEAFELADQWSRGESPVVETLDFLQRSVSEVPHEFAVSYVQVIRMLVNGNLGQDADVQIATLCRGLALVLDLPPH